LLSAVLKGDSVPNPAAGSTLAIVDVEGDNAVLVQSLREPLVQALSERHAFYHVTVESVGRAGEVLVGITGSKGHLPLLFRRDQLEAGYISRVVRDTIERFGL
jgi:hypothetical protein